MPYIAKEKREWAAKAPEDAGELNYVITLAIQDYVHYKGLKYQTLNDVVGVLESAKAEFQRRIVGPYEDTKIAINGDVYDQSLLSRTDVRDPQV